MFLAGNTPQWVIIVSAILAAILALLTVLLIAKLTSKRKKKEPKLVIDEEFMDKLMTAYGNKDNITDVKVDNGRLKITVNDLDKVDLEYLKSISTAGVFVTGTTIKTLFKHDSETIKKSIERRG